MIPKKIHFCWFGGKLLPRDVEQCIRSWRKYCPEYEIIRWDESNFDLNCHPFVASSYEAKAWAFVSDYARLQIVYDQGGIYLDTDVEIIRKIDELLKDSCFVGIQQTMGWIASGLGFGAEAGHPMVKAMLDEYEGLVYREENKAEYVCPLLNTEAFVKHGYVCSDEIVTVHGAKVYPPKFFDPYTSGKGEDLMCKDTYSIHHYSATWTGGKQRLKRKFARFIGEKNIIRIKKILKR